MEPTNAKLFAGRAQANIKLNNFTGRYPINIRRDPVYVHDVDHQISWSSSIIFSRSFVSSHCFALSPSSILRFVSFFRRNRASRNPYFVRYGGLWKKAEGKTNPRMARILHQLQINEEESKTICSFN
ncbi:hypothetical protein Vadar_015079 [Vaccinium darrowii]|uniref:Uncharacterized protein n=1 Tax=Vaccinium darrowii TaxID=229202 RepID=A0ACB7ZBM6_9ERIC|nr:hypothetical protein Vadar_015079 [Vaccinium darrowii]